MIKTKRIYEPYERGDGYRVLVDRLWPRGVSKEKAKLHLWLKDVGPTSGLRKWFGHKLDRWSEFKRKYKSELKTNPAFPELKKLAKKHKNLTLLYAAKDPDHNEAVILAEMLK